MFNMINLNWRIYVRIKINLYKIILDWGKKITFDSDRLKLKYYSFENCHIIYILNYVNGILMQ